MHIPGSCEYATLHHKSNLAAMTQFRALIWGDYSGLTRWAQSNPQILEKGRNFPSWDQRGRCDCGRLVRHTQRGSVWKGGKRPWARSVNSLQKLEKARKLFLEPPEVNTALQTPSFPSDTSIGSSLEKCKKITWVILTH